MNVETGPLSTCCASWRDTGEYHDAACDDQVDRDTRHARLSNPDLWHRMTFGEQAAYNNGWLQATLNILDPSQFAPPSSSSHPARHERTR